MILLLCGLHFPLLISVVARCTRTITVHDANTSMESGDVDCSSCFLALGRLGLAYIIIIGIIVVVVHVEHLVGPHGPDGEDEVEEVEEPVFFQ